MDLEQFLPPDGATTEVNLDITVEFKYHHRLGVVYRISLSQDGEVFHIGHYVDAVPNSNTLIAAFTMARIDQFFRAHGRIPMKHLKPISKRILDS